MKTNKLLLSLLAVMMIVIAGSGISACGNDDDDSGSGIEGTWTGVDGRTTLSMTFKSDYTGTWVSKYEDKYSGTETENGTFTYSMSGSNKGTILLKTRNSSYYSGSNTEVLTFTIEGKTMLLYDSDNRLIMALTKGGGSIIDDDDDVTTSIVGTWASGTGNESMTMTFTNSGTGTWILKYYDSYYGTETERGSFTYSMNGSTKGYVSLRIDDSYSGNNTLIWYFKIDGKKMYLYQDSSYSDLLITLTKQ